MKDPPIVHITFVLHLVSRGGDDLYSLGRAQGLTQLYNEERAARAGGYHKLTECEVQLVHLQVLNDSRMAGEARINHHKVETLPTFAAIADT